MTEFEITSNETSTLIPVQQVMGPNALSIFKGAVGDCNFDGRNYFAWRAKVNAALRSIGLGEFVMGSTVDPERDQKLGDMITMIMSSPMINAYRDCLGSGRELLRRLDAEYNRKSQKSDVSVTF